MAGTSQAVQTTLIGRKMRTCVGTTSLWPGRGIAKDHMDIDGRAVMPADADIRQWRPLEQLQRGELFEAGWATSLDVRASISIHSATRRTSGRGCSLARINQ